MCERRLFGLDDGLVCSGDGEGHEHTYRGTSGVTGKKHEDDGGES